MSPPKWSRRTVLGTIGTALFAGCTAPVAERSAPTQTESPGAIATPRGSFTPDEDWTAPADPPTTGVTPNVLVENLEIPWDIAEAPNGDLFITERVGRVNRFTAGELEEVLAPKDAIDAESVPPGSDERPWWIKGVEGGTLGAAVHPDYPDVSSLYVYYTASVSGDKVNRVSRFDVSAADPAETETVVIDDIPAHKVHNGGRIEFGPWNHLWVTTGTASFDKDEASGRAADPSSLAGKVLRVTARGEPARDNPDLGADADPRVYTYGHRNPQGIVWLPDGTPIVNEHGGGGHDEINRLVAGDYYGWPNAPRNEEKYTGNDDVHPPLANTGRTTWAPSGSVFYTGDDIPSWSNRMLIGGLISQQIIVVTITPPEGDLPPIGENGWRFDAGWYDDAYVATAHPVLQDDLGRVRHLEQGVAGGLYAITSNRDGRAQKPFPRERDDVLVRLETT